MLQHLIIQFSHYYLSSVRLRKVKNKTKFQTLSSKSGHGRLQEVVAYRRWSLTRGSKYSDFTRKLLVFWKTGRLRELVATGGSTVRQNQEISLD